MTEPRYRIVGGCGARERIVATGLTREEASARVEELQRDAILPGLWFAFEEERQAASFEAWAASAGNPHRG